MPSSILAAFPGQGSQAVGMGRELIENFALARHVFEEASEAIQFDLKALCLDGPADRLTLTENTQPALLTIGIAAYRVFCSEIGAKPQLFAGHSLGEYTALVAADSLSLPVATRLVRARGQAMQRAVAPGLGKMLAVLGGEDADIEAACAEGTANARQLRANSEVGQELQSIPCTAETANFNSPGQTVISGSADAIDETAKVLQSKKLKAIPLDVSAPFHSSLMAPARAFMQAEFDKLSPADRPKNPSAGFVPNRTARAHAEAGIVLKLLAEQIDHAVLWKQSMESVLQSGCTRIVEFGPGAVLQGLFKRCAKPAAISVETWGVNDLSTLKACEALR